MSKKSIKIATRMSDLALWQAKWVGDLLCKNNLNLQYELVPILTQADQHEKPLHNLGGKGEFVKAIQEAVLDGRADLAVHSAKDLPCITIDGLLLAAVPLRHAAEDVLVANTVYAKLPRNAVIATSSVRRVKQLQLLRSDIIFKEIRGNIPTRIGKYLSNEFDGIILARAGIERLNLEKHIQEIFATNLIVPAAGQGTLAIECKHDNDIINLLSKINHHDSYNALIAERSCMHGLGGHCFAPIGVFSYFKNGVQFIEAAVIGQKKLFVKLSGQDSVHLGLNAAQMLNDQGAQQLIQELKND